MKTKHMSTFGDDLQEALSIRTLTLEELGDKGLLHVNTAAHSRKRV